MAKRTKEEIKAWRDKMIGLSRKIKAIPESERFDLWKKIGTITPEGHVLSCTNTIMLYYQAGRMLNQVGGYQQWKKFGRQVKEGEKAVGSIMVPMRSNNDEGDDDMRFISVPVFDISQTDPIEQAVTV